jgi:hypothetical protein
MQKTNILQIGSINQTHNLHQIINKKKSQISITTIGIWDFNFIISNYAFLFKVALNSIEIEERSIFNLPLIVSIITVVSASSAILP